MQLPIYLPLHGSGVGAAGGVGGFILVIETGIFPELHSGTPEEKILGSLLSIMFLSFKIEAEEATEASTSVAILAPGVDSAPMLAR